MKICFLVNSYPKLSETFILNQAIGLQERGHDVCFIADSPANEQISHPEIKEYGFEQRTEYYSMPSSRLKRLLKSPVPVIKLLKRNPKDVVESLKFWEYGKPSLSLKMLYLASSFSRFKDLDVIHAHFGPNGKNLQPLRSAGILENEIITSFYGRDASETLQNDPNAFKELFDSQGKITVLSEDMKQKLTSKGCPEIKIEKVPLCIDTDKFELENTQNEIPKILTVARFTEKKGLKYAVEALSEIDEEFEYHMVGDGELREKIEKQVEQHSLEDKVVFHGWMTNEEVKEKMQESDIFLLPSIIASDGDQEGTPTVLLEAQATGLPVVSTYHAGIPEIVEDGKTGLLSEEKDVESLSENLMKLIENLELRREFGKAGREYIEHNHSMEKVSKRLENIYES